MGRSLCNYVRVRRNVYISSVSDTAIMKEYCSRKLVIGNGLGANLLDPKMVFEDGHVQDQRIFRSVLTE